MKSSVMNYERIVMLPMEYNIDVHRSNFDLFEIDEDLANGDFTS